LEQLQELACWTPEVYKEKVTGLRVPSLDPSLAHSHMHLDTCSWSRLRLSVQHNPNWFMMRSPTLDRDSLKITLRVVAIFYLKNTDSDRMKRHLNTTIQYLI